MKTFITFLLAVIMFSIGGCGTKQESPALESVSNETVLSGPTVTLDSARRRFAGIVVESVTSRAIPRVITVPGKVEYDQRRLSHLTSRVEGRVEDVFAFLGDRVQANQFLATIYSQEYLTTQAEFVQAEERLQAALSRRDSSEVRTATSIYESVQRKLLVIGASREELEELARTHVPKTFLEVRAPFAGVVTEVNEILGHFVEIGTLLFHIADLSSVWVVVDIHEKDLPLVRAGIHAEVEATPYAGEYFPGQLTRIFEVVDERTRTIKGRVELPNPGHKLKSGMFVTVRLHAGQTADAVVIPATAVQIAGADRYVFVAASNSAFQKRIVTTGEESGKFVQIVQGLAAGERVVTDGAFTLKSEMLKTTLGEE